MRNLFYYSVGISLGILFALALNGCSTSTTYCDKYIGHDKKECIRTIRARQRNLLRPRQIEERRIFRQWR